MAVEYLHVSYDFIDSEGELMLVMPKVCDEPADDENAKLVFDGFAEAMLVRNSNRIIHLNIVVERVRNMLAGIKTILVTEMDGEDIDDVYEAQVEVLNGSLPIPKEVYDSIP